MGDILMIKIILEIWKEMLFLMDIVFIWCFIDFSLFIF